MAFKHHSVPKLRRNLLCFFLALLVLLVGCDNFIEKPDINGNTQLTQGQTTEAPVGSESQELPTTGAQSTTGQGTTGVTPPNEEDPENPYVNFENLSTTPIDLSAIAPYANTPYAVVNGNKPFFTSQEITPVAFEHYGNLDALGRCTVAFASCGKETMPKEDEDRGSISSIKPTGWIQAEYDCVSGKSLYNRCHLIGWQLSAENANRQNLITGTRYLNAQGMLPFENMIADYIKETGNHVMYRVTPIFEGNHLVASGVQMEAYSVEDGGEGICFNVYCYNVQPQILIDYVTGSSQLSGETPPSNDGVVADYVLNTNTRKIHHPNCSSVTQMSDKNRQEYTGTVEDLLEQGYKKCGNCF